MRNYCLSGARPFSLALIVFLFLSTVSWCQTPQYFKGLGTSTNTIPMNNTGSHAQQMYLPGDFNLPPVSGLITKIYFRNSVAGASGTYNNFSVAFIQNSLTQFANSTFLTGLTTALSAPSITINGNATAGGWYEIVLDNPFLYDNTQTLVVEIKYDSKTGGMSGYTTSAGVGVNKRLSIVTAPGPLTGNLSSIWGDYGMDIVPNSPCTFPPTAGGATASATPVCSGSPVILNLSGHSMGSGQTYVWQSSSLAAGPYTDISSSSTFSNFTVNPTVSNWYRAAVTCSGNTSFSDPVEVIVTPPLAAGTYTVNPALPPGAGNYQSLQAAVNAMECGIAGPVIFNVASGGSPYNEQVLIPSIAGASTTNTITFNGNGSVIQATPVTAARYLVRLDGADFVRFNNFSLLALPGSTFGWGVHFFNGADNNIIDNCTVDISAVTSTTQSNSAGIVASGSATSVVTDGSASNNIISNNTIIGAYQGIIFNGATGALDAVNNRFSNNEVRDFLITGIEITENDGAVILNNNVHRSNRTDIGTTVSQGIELGAGNINCVVDGNRIHDSHTAAATQSGTFYGIISTADDAPVGSENRIINNLIYRLNSLTGTQYGLYNSSSSGVYYYHNTVVLDNATSTSGITRGFYQLTLADNIQFRNNIVYIGRGGTGVKYAVYFGTTTSTILSNNNVLWNVSTDGTNGIGSFGSTGYATLLDWQGANGGIYDQQSLSIDPLFMDPSTANYTPMSLQVNDQGAAVGVATDINNNPRNATTPDPGAFEFDIASGINMGAEMLVDPLAGGPGCFPGAQPVVIRIKNSSPNPINFATNPVTVTTNVTGTVTQTLSAVINTGSLASDATLDVPMSATLNMSANGIYIFNAFTTVTGDVFPGNNAMPEETRTGVPLVTGNITATPDAFCLTPGTPTLSAPAAAGYGSVQWQQSTTPGSGFADIPGATTNPFTLASPISQTMYYRLVAGCDGTTATSGEVTVSLFNPAITGTTPDVICGSGTATLAATGTGNTTFNWYANAAGGVTIGTGSPFVTPVISNTTTFYVSATTGGVSANTGLPAELAGTTGAGTTNFGLVFDVLSPFTLQNVTVYPVSSTAGVNSTVTIDVINGSGAIVHTATVNVVGNPSASATPQVVTLNFNLQPGTNYKLRPGSRGPGITGLLFEPSATAPPGGNYGYPFVVPGILSINHSTLSAAPGNTPRLDLYYYFYNWSISNGCESPRTPVVATVEPAPSATLSYAGSPYCAASGTATITHTGTTGGTYSSTAGLVINSSTGQIDLGASTPGTYTVTYTVPPAGSCPQFDFTTSITITTPPAATIAYTGSPYCNSGGTANVTHTGTTGGTYSSTTGLSINPATGAVNLGASVPGNYTVTYTIAASGGCPVFTTTAAISVAPGDSWVGTISSDWNNPGNWCGGIPGANSSVRIPPGVPNMPVLSGGSGSVRHITIMAGATLTIGTGGTLNLHGDIYNSGAFNASAGSIHFRGATTQKIPSFTALDVVQDGAGLFLLGDAEILRELEMIKGNILLNGHTVSLSGTSTGSFASHIVMDNNSSVRVIGLAAGNNRFIPVGTSPGSYTPVSFAANSGHATDDFTITLKPGVFANGVSGDTYTRDIVNRTWYISENVPGGSNVDMSFGWMEMEEFPGFDRIRSQVIRLEANQWVGGPIATATGTALYTTTMPNVSSFTAFAVRSETLPIVKQGALYPNPASSELNVVVNLPAETQVVISIYDVKGSLMMKQQATVNAGLSRTTLDISRLYAGAYLLRVTGPSGEEVYAERFVKAR